MSDIIITSSHNLEGFNIIEYIEFVSVEVVLGTGLFSEFKASFSDLFGTRSVAFQEKLAAVKEHGLKEIRNKAKNLNGNAVISVDMDYINFSDNIIGLIINGTVVKAVKNNYSITVEERPDEINLVDIECPVIISDKSIIRKYERGVISAISVNYTIISKIETVINAIKFHIEIFNCFGENIQIAEKNYIRSNFNANEKNHVSFSIFECELEHLDHVEIIIDRIQLSDGTNWNTNNKLISPDIAPKDIYFFKEYFGIDAISYPKLDNDTWICVCGKRNEPDLEKCENCNRYKKDVLVSIDEIRMQNRNIDPSRMENSKTNMFGTVLKKCMLKLTSKSHYQKLKSLINLEYGNGKFKIVILNKKSSF